MNIFVLDHDPIVAGTLLCDEHLRICGVTYTQLLVNQHNTDKPPNRWAKPTLTGVSTSPQKVDHPCNQWVAKGVANYQWLLELTKSVWAEYRHRFHIEHPCESTFKPEIGQLPWMGGGHMTTPPICLPSNWQPDDEKPGRGTKLWTCIDAYRNFYKFVSGNWTERPEPGWMTFKTNRYINPRDAKMDLEAENFLSACQKDADFQQLKAAVDAKYEQQPRHYHGESTGFAKTFKRIY